MATVSLHNAHINSTDFQAVDFRVRFINCNCIKIFLKKLTFENVHTQ